MRLRSSYLKGKSFVGHHLYQARHHSPFHLVVTGKNPTIPDPEMKHPWDRFHHWGSVREVTMTYTAVKTQVDSELDSGPFGTKGL